MFFVNYKQSLILLLKKQWNEPFNHTFIIFRIPKSETQKKKLRKKTVCQNIWNIQWLSKSYPSSSFFLENLPKKFEPFLFISDFCLLSFHLIDLFWSLLVLFYFGQVFFQFFPVPLFDPISASECSPSGRQSNFVSGELLKWQLKRDRLGFSLCTFRWNHDRALVNGFNWTSEISFFVAYWRFSCALCYQIC